MSEIIIETNKLCKTFSTGGRQQHVLKNLDLKIYKGDFTVIMGASGSGKSTLLYSLSGMDHPTLGNIQVNNSDITAMTGNQLALFRRKHCGFVFQQIHLLENMSVLDNILACGLLLKQNRNELADRAKNLLLQVDIQENEWGKFPAQLSGGEAQRVGIVRALINQPEIVFADEPTGALNSTSGTQVLDTLTEVNRLGQSIVAVTHDMRTARRGNRVIYLKDGMIFGECILSPYQGTEEARSKKLSVFLQEMGW